MNPVYDPFLRKMVSGPEAGQNTSVDGFQVNALGGTGSALYNVVAPIDLTGSTFSLALSTVRDILTGTPVIEAIDVATLRGALTAGQAVDVTSQPDGVTGDYKGTFTVTGSLGFASFPKYASGLNYLMIADLTAAASGTVTPSGTWLDGTTAAKSLAAGIPTRVAMLFNAANKSKLTFASTGSVSVTNCREYEVTACSAEAVAYIAQLASPDAFASYYLVKPDMVQPWTSIIDMGSSPAVTIASGLSYKLNAATGTHQLTVDTCPAGYDGRDAIIRITLGGSGVIQAVSPLQLGGALIPNAINNCVVRFRDGEAVLLVEDTLAGYIVTVNSGTGEGSLPYGLAASGLPYVAFSTSTDGIPIDLSGATTAAEEVTVVGNGYEETILTGSITCTSKTTVANLSLQDVVVNGGIMTLGDAYIPSGSTVAVSGGGLAVKKVTGAGSESVIDLGGTHVSLNYGDTLVANNITFSGGNANSGGCFFINGSMTLTSVAMLKNTASRGACMYINNGAALVVLNACEILNNTPSLRAVYMKDGTLALNGRNTLGDTVLGQNGHVTLTSGAILDLTGNKNATPIAPGGGITFEQGGATVLVGSGTTSSSYMMDNVTLPAGATLTNTAVVNLGGSRVAPENAPPINMSGCTILGGGFTLWETGLTATSCTFSSCGSSGFYGGAIQGQYEPVNLSSCVFSNNIGSTRDLSLNNGCVATISACTFGGEITAFGGTTVVNIAGENTIEVLHGSGSCVISSGASINLTSSIAPGGGIAVLEGGCTVNGVTVEPGTYTSIVSSGGSAVINQ